MGNVVNHVVDGIVHLTEDAVNGFQDFLHHIDANHHGKEWLKPVVDGVRTVDLSVGEETGQSSSKQQHNIVHWKSLDEWKQHYEPMNEQGEESYASKLQEQVVIEAKRRAKDMLIHTMNSRMTHRVFRLVLDVTSEALSIVEERMKKSDSNTNQAASAIINNLNGILLTYRFQRCQEKHKIEYLRRVATDSLTAILWEECKYVKQEVETTVGDENGLAQARILALRRTLHDTVTSMENDITRNSVEEHLDAMLTKATELQDRVENKAIDITQHAQSFEGRLAALDVATRHAVSVADQIVGEAADSLDIEIEKVDSEGNVETTVSPTKAVLDATRKMQSEVVKVEEIINKEEEIVMDAEATLDVLQERVTNAPAIRLVIKDYILKRFHQDDRSWTMRILRHVDHLLLEYYEIYATTRLAMAKEQKSHRLYLTEVQEKMSQRVDGMAKNIYELVRGEVEMATGTLGALMVHHELAEEEVEFGRA